MKRILPMFLTVALLLCATVVPMCALADSEASISVTASCTTPAVGDIITVTVAFTSCPANINTLELIVPIDTNAFELVDSNDIPMYELEKNADTTGGSAFRNKNTENLEAFINFVDVVTPLLGDSTTIMTFDLKVKGAGKLTVSESDSFLVDEIEEEDILWSVNELDITIGDGNPTPETQEPEETTAPTEAPDAQPTAEVAPTVVPTVRPTKAPEVPKTGSTMLTVVVAAVLLIAAVATTGVVLSNRED